MADIATCPKCAKQLGLPDSAGVMDRAECPECGSTFALSETVQISLPVARLLPPEPEVTPESIPSAIEPHDDRCADELQSADAPKSCEATPQQSWEERLKRALALDASEEVETSAASAENCESADESTVGASAEKVNLPSFDFQLDPPSVGADESVETSLDATLPSSLPHPPQEIPDTAELASDDNESSKKESGTKRAGKPVKTLADFAASAVNLATEKVPTSTAAAKENPMLQRSTDREAAASNDMTIKKQVSGRRLARTGFPKVSAFVVGPIVGTLVGLYGLLWLQGPKGDHLGMSHVLPASMLPAQLGELAEEPAVAESGTSLHKLLSKKKSEHITPEIKRDSAVQLASASRQVKPSTIEAGEFVALVDAASAALPDFIGGGLTSQASIKNKGQAYMALCRLSEYFDFSQQPGLSPTIEAKVREAVKLFMDAAGDVRLRNDLAHIAGRWWDYQQRPNAGIFFTGRVREAKRTDQGTLCWVQLGDSASSSTIPVWVKSGRFQVDDQVGVVGRLIASPDGLPQDFTGTQVVKLLHSFAL